MGISRTLVHIIYNQAYNCTVDEVAVKNILKIIHKLKDESEVLALLSDHSGQAECVTPVYKVQPFFFFLSALFSVGFRNVRMKQSTADISGDV